MHIDIEKLELADVLVALVNAGATNTMTIHGKLPKLTNRMANELIEEGKAAGNLYFDSILGRVLKIDLNDDVIDVGDYDRANGYGSALKTLKTVGEATASFRTEMRNTEIHERGAITDRLVDAPRPDTVMSEASIRRRITGEQYMELAAKKFVPNKAEIDAWLVRFNAASPAERDRMINDDSIKCAYLPKTETYALDHVLKEHLGMKKIPAPEHVVHMPKYPLEGDILNSVIFKDSGEMKAALRTLGDNLVSVDVVAQNAILPEDHPMPMFEGEHRANKARLLKERVAELGDKNSDGYYVIPLADLDSANRAYRDIDSSIFDKPSIKGFGK